VSLYILADTF